MQAPVKQAAATPSMGAMPQQAKAARAWSNKMLLLTAWQQKLIQAGAHHSHADMLSVSQVNFTTRSVRSREPKAPVCSHIRQGIPADHMSIHRKAPHQSMLRQQALVLAQLQKSPLVLL